MMFNHQRNSFTFEDIKQETCIPEQELERHLLSLAHPKIKILIKQPNTKVIEPSHTFTYNNAYKNRLFRVKVPLLASKSKSELEKKSKIPDEVLEARKNRFNNLKIYIYSLGLGLGLG